MAAVDDHFITLTIATFEQYQYQFVVYYYSLPRLHTMYLQLIPIIAGNRIIYATKTITSKIITTLEANLEFICQLINSLPSVSGGSYFEIGGLFGTCSNIW